MADSWMGRMETRSVTVITLGMVLIVLGVVHGTLFVPGVWVLVLGFVALIGSAIYGIVKDRA